MKKILFVENEKPIQQLFIEELDCEYDIKLASSSGEAVSYLENVLFEIVVLDLNLGDRNQNNDFLLDNILFNRRIKLDSEIFILSGYPKNILIFKERYEHIVNPKNIYKKPYGMFELIKALKDRILK